MRYFHFQTFSLQNQNTPLMSSKVEERARVICRMRLHSALRTALAYLIVGGATIYGPKVLVNKIKFAAFSYLTAVLIVSDASLGDTLKGCWHAFCATAQVVPLAMLVRRNIDPTGGLSVGMAAAAVALAAFLVALPESTHMTAKKIAFGQIVLVCADAVASEDTRAGFMHPAYIAASTALGAFASVLAMVIPYPSLASDKVQRLCKAYAEIASERMNIYLRAFSAPDNHTKMELLSQAKPLTETGVKLLQSIRILEGGIQWERPWRRFLKPSLAGPGDRLERMELQMRGIEYSLASSPALSVQVVDQEQFSNFLQSLSIQLEEKIKQVRCFSPFHSMIEPETEREFKEKPALLPIEPTSLIFKQGWVFFFFTCVDLFLNESAMDTSIVPREVQTQRTRTEPSIIRTFKTCILKLCSSKRLEFAFKCSLSLGLAMLFGLIFDKTNGRWAGLAIAISFVTGKQAVFTMANARGQGTAIGSVYGVICCFLFHYEELRLLALLPWIIFTSFLRHSKMYGQTGGVAAAVGALFILGRKNYGVPNGFAIARLAEVFIGLSAFIFVELFLQTTRASTLAKNHLCLTLCCLQDCLKETGICPDQKNKTVNKHLELRDKQRNLNHLVCDLKKFIADAELEPDFWYLPFCTSSYRKLSASLSNIVDMMYFITYNVERLSELSQNSTACKEFQEQINRELELFQETLRSSQVHLPKAYSTESQTDSQENLRDLEAGQPQIPENVSSLITDHKEVEKTTEEEDSEDNKRVSERMIQFLGAIGFCISSLTKELEEIEVCRRELDGWEN
ncbi:hypothetical protein CDL12_16535 [Handroanthus impetiginosus]|uniref:Integral membrane bound transporter domain-containing protein n=1 Tax=Handroanthus impetiginosus TaxID=429701 RepID=A0A2G9H032_9LAMI|nr:hypothetical protein CDL12_16535 [Handroanthus impetiginosus]